MTVGDVLLYDTVSLKVTIDPIHDTCAIKNYNCINIIFYPSYYSNVEYLKW